jgi:hypothetical protein
MTMATAVTNTTTATSIHSRVGSQSSTPIKMFYRSPVTAVSPYRSMTPPSQPFLTDESNIVCDLTHDMAPYALDMSSV